MPTTTSPASRTLESPSKPRRHAATNLTALDLFAGAGGFSAGLHAGSERFETVRAIEIDLEAAASYAQNFGDVVYAGDIEKWLMEEEVPQVDVVVGGPPCQGFSTLGKQDASDVRNLMWRHYVSTVDRARPRAFILENVPAFLKSHQFAMFTETFEPGGRLREYSFMVRVLNAAEYGAAQVRKRVVVMGVHRDIGHPDIPMPDILQAPRTVRDAFDGIKPFAGERELPHRAIQFRGRELRGAFKSSELHIGRDHTALSLARIRSIPYGGGRFDLPEKLQAECWRKHRKGSGDVMGRLIWESPSVTIRTEFFKPEKGRYLHPTQHRAITHFEAARIQGFPDEYKFVGSKTSIARQIGNAVPIPLGAALGRHLAALLT